MDGDINLKASYFSTGLITGGGPNAIRFLTPLNRISVIQEDNPSASATSYSFTAITGDGPQSYRLIAPQARVSVVQEDSPSVAAKSFSISTVTSNGAINVRLLSTIQRVSLIISEPIAAISSERLSVIIDQVPQGIPTYIKSGFSQVASELPVPPAEMVFSTMNCQGIYSHAAIQSDEMPMPKSYEFVKSSSLEALCETIMPVAVSMERVSSSAEMVLMSSNIKHVQVSMNYIYGTSLRALVAKKPDPLWVSNASFKSIARLSLVGRSEDIPVSSTSIGHLSQMELIPSDYQGHVGTVYSASVSDMVLVSSPAYMFIGPEFISSSLSMALVETKDPEPLGIIENSSVSEMSVESASYDSIEDLRSSDYHAEIAQSVIMNTPYPSVTGMAGANAVSMFEKVLTASSLPEVVSTMCSAQTGLHWLVDSNYPTPESMKPLEGAAIDHSIHHKTLTADPHDMPVSYIGTPNIAMHTIVGVDEPSPEEVVNTGLFSKFVVETVACVAEYNPASAAFSTLSSGLVLESVALPDTSFPDKSLSKSDLSSRLIIENISYKDDSFPDKDMALSYIKSWVNYEVVPVTDNDFLPKWWPFSALESSQVLEIVASQVNDYPSKEMVHSHLQAGAVGEILASSVSYPDKSTPMSNACLSLVSQVVACKDATLYGMKGMPLKRRPKISISVVY